MQTVEEIQKWNRKTETLSTKEKSGIDKKTVNPSRLRIVTCHFTETNIEMMNDLVKKEYFANRAELIRQAINELLLKYRELELIMI